MANTAQMWWRLFRRYMYLLTELMSSHKFSTLYWTKHAHDISRKQIRFQSLRGFFSSCVKKTTLACLLTLWHVYSFFSVFSFLIDCNNNKKRRTEKDLGHECSGKNVKESLHTNNKKEGVECYCKFSGWFVSFSALAHLLLMHSCMLFLLYTFVPTLFHSKQLGRLQDADIGVVIHLEPFLPCRDHMWPASRGATFYSGSISTREKHHLTSPCRLTNPKSCTTQSYCHQKHSGINFSSVYSCTLFSKAWLFHQTGHEYHLFERNRIWF